MTPVHPQAHPSASTSPAPDEPRRLRVLIVDDDEDIRALLSLTLSMSFDVIEASGGVEAVQMLRQGTAFDIAVLDVMMPQVDGFQVAQAIREERPGVPVVMLSALSDPEAKRRGAEVGARQYFVKPFDPMALSSTLAALAKAPSILQTAPALADQTA